MFNPNNIRNKGFSVQKSGYSTDEVSDYLQELADGYAALVKENQEKDAKIEKLVEKVNELLADKDAITDVLVNAQKEARKIVSEAKAQAKEMVDGAKNEQMRLAEQSAAECEKIVTEHKEKCARLIRDNTVITEKKLNTIRAAYDEEIARYKQLQADVTYFKANLIELYKEQIQLVMDIPTMSEQELDEFEASFDEDGNYVPKDTQIEQEAQDLTSELVESAAQQQSDEEAARVDKILNTGSFEPVIPKSTLNDLQFGKNN